MNTNLLQIRYRSVQAKYAKLLKRCQKKLVGGLSFTARQLADMQRKIEKYSRQLAELTPNLAQAGRMAVLGSSVALGVTISSCGGDDDDPTPKLDFKKLSFTQVTGSANPASSIKNRFSVPALADLNGDGKPDLTVAYWYNSADSTEYYTNTGTASSPAFAKQTGSANTLPKFSGRKTRTFADLDNDGDLDAIFEGSGLRYYKNIGSRNAPNFVRLTDDSPLNTSGLGTVTSPILGDIDGDGDYDLTVTNRVSSSEYQIQYYENTGTRTAPAFTQRTGTANPFSNIALSDIYDAAGVLADLDNDGDLDLVIGDYYGTLSAYENTGSRTNPVFTARTGTANPFNGISGGYSSTPTFADIDADGDLDLMIGSENNGILFYKNSTVR